MKVVGSEEVFIQVVNPEANVQLGYRRHSQECKEDHCLPVSLLWVARFISTLGKLGFVDRVTLRSFFPSAALEKNLYSYSVSLFTLKMPQAQEDKQTAS